MALITCPECGKDVSSTAKACPHCGCPIIQKEAIDNKMVNHEPATSDNNSTHVWALIGVAVLAIFIIIVVSLSHSSSSYDSHSSYSYEEVSSTDSHSVDDYDASTGATSVGYTTSTSNNPYEDPRAFNSADQVLAKLCQSTFTNPAGDITLRFRHDGMYANGQQLTGAIMVESFDAVSAIIRCSSMYNGATFSFQYIQDVLVKEQHSGEIYYYDK